MTRRKVALVIIDYLQLLTPAGRFENRTQEVSAMSRGLKLIAQELGIPFLVLSQLKRFEGTREPDLSGSKVGQKKEAAIAALLAERNLAEAARAVGIDLSTLKRWMREPEFIQDYRRARWEVVEQGYARIQQNTPAAASVLFSILWLKPPAFSRIAFSF
jgi:DNA invertase Pin-like site-specific DNA recombinase